jgi:hypothetical protein
MAAPQPKVQPEPICLDAVLVAGATVGGVRVVRMVCELESGGRFELATPVITTTTSELSEREQAIVDTLRDSDMPLTRRQIARMLHLESERGAFGQAVSRLRDTGVIFEQSGEYSDAVSKFRDTS